MEGIKLSVSEQLETIFSFKELPKHLKQTDEHCYMAGVRAGLEIAHKKLTTTPKINERE